MRLRRFCSRLHVIGAVGLAAAVLGVGACGGSLPSTSTVKVEGYIQGRLEQATGDQFEVKVHCVAQSGASWHCPATLYTDTGSSTATVYVREQAGSLQVTGTSEPVNKTDRQRG